MFKNSSKLLLFTALSLVYPATLHAETMAEAIQSAIAQHPTIEEAVAAQKAAHEDVVTERSNYFPVLSASTAAGRVYGDNATSRGLSVTRGSGYSNLWEGSLAINQMIFDGLKTPRMVGASKAREEAATATIAQAQNALALQTSLAYLNTLRSRESLKMLSDYQGTLVEYKDKIGKMVADGGADDAELQQAEVITLQLKNLMANFAGQVKTADAEYFQLTGHLPDTSLTRPTAFPLLPESPEAALAEARQNHPLLKSADKQIEAADLTVDAQRSALYPEITGELSTYRKDVRDIIGGEVEDDRALIRASWDFSTGGAELASIRKAEQESAQSNARRKDALRSLESTIRTAYANLSTAVDQQAILKERMTAEEKLLGTYKTQFEGGKVRILQLLQSENQQLNARLDLLNAEYRYLAALYSVLGSTGHLQDRLAAAPVKTAAANVQ